MTQWQVQLTGDVRDLDYLTNVMGEGARKVLREVAGGYLYESNSFLACVDSSEVEILAEKEVAVLSGILKVERGSRDRLNYGAVIKLNATGRRDIFVRIREALHVRAEVSAMLAVIRDAKGNVIPQSDPPLARSAVLLQLSISEPSIAKVLRLLSALDARSWSGLYRIFEVIEGDVGGQRRLEEKDWCSASDLDRFKHSANSVSVGGDAARHGTERHQPPKNPMTLSEAEAYVNFLVQGWFSSKGA